MTLDKQMWSCKKTQDNHSHWFASPYDMSGTQNGTTITCTKFRQKDKRATTINQPTIFGPISK